MKSLNLGYITVGRYKDIVEVFLLPCPEQQGVAGFTHRSSPGLLTISWLGVGDPFVLC